MSIQIIQGDCREKLKELPAESVDCCITSPPYYGLRDYNTEDLIWGGNDNCDHEWGKISHPPKGGMYTEDKKDIWKNKPATGNNKKVTITQARLRNGYKTSVCIKCGAWKGSLGLEPTPEIYVNNMVSAFREVKRVLKKSGSLWLNIGDSYYNYRPGINNTQRIAKNVNLPVESPKRNNKLTNIKEKDLIGIPWMAAFALRNDGWYLRMDIIWHKPNTMPESVKDRPTKSHEYLFLLTKSKSYYCDMDAIREPHVSMNDLESRRILDNKDKTYLDRQDLASRSREEYYHPKGRNKRSVWMINTEAKSGGHYAKMPSELVKNCVLAGCPEKGIVLDPFAGSGTVGEVAERYSRNSILIELNQRYVGLIKERTAQIGLFV